MITNVTDEECARDKELKVLAKQTDHDDRLATMKWLLTDMVVIEEKQDAIDTIQIDRARERELKKKKKRSEVSTQ